MDWARAKNILILILILLNVALAGTIVNRVIGIGADRALYANVIKILDMRGITMDCQFPKKITTSESLIYGDGSRFVETFARALNKGGGEHIEMMSRESLRYTNSRPDELLNTASMNTLDNAIRSTLLEKGADITNFITDYSTKGGDGSFFYQYILDYNGKLVFDSSVSVTVTREGGISEITVNYREIKSISSEKLMKVIPAYQVILRNYYEYGGVIHSINLGYIGRTKRDNPYKELPEDAVWRIRLEDGTERFFEANYGDETYLYSQI